MIIILINVYKGVICRLSVWVSKPREELTLKLTGARLC